MRIAVDAMGGDRAPDAPAAAALEARRTLGVRVVLVGPEAACRAALKRAGAGRGEGGGNDLEVASAGEVIAPDEHPVRALRQKPGASIPVGVRLVQEGRADAFVSAGSTGALMAAALLGLGRIPGIDRPALTVVLPSLQGPPTVFLDVGANADARPEHLLQFGIMGSIYAAEVLGRPRPRVGLLNIGAEPGKGSELYKAAYDRLAGAGLEFVGNVEARDLPAGVADVVVADGFVGNVVLKHTEGLASTLFGALRQEFRRRPVTALGALLARPAFVALRRRMDYREHGGAPLLGIAGVVVKCHGSSDVTALTNGIRVARDAVRSDLVGRIRARLEDGGEEHVTG